MWLLARSLLPAAPQRHQGGGRRRLDDAIAAADFGSVLFAASRLVHLAAIIAALILMFHPAANAYIRATRRTRPERNRADIA